MKLMFVGDIVWPHDDCLDVKRVLPGVEDVQLVGNLEGAIRIPSTQLDDVINRYKFNLHTAPSFINVARSLNMIGFSLANNHIGDYKMGIEPTINVLTHHGFKCFGLDSLSFTEFRTSDGPYLVVGLCSPLTEIRGDGGAFGINIFNPDLSLMMIRKLRKNYSGVKIAVFIHWGYELAQYPEPADREWARRVIDAGADYVIGHHPHVVQGVESYKHGLIAYSLGNFLLPQVRFGERILHYDDERVRQQLGIVVGDNPEMRWFQYEPEKKRVSYVKSEPYNENAHSISVLSPFSGMSDIEYRSWFKSEVIKNPASRMRAGPVFWSYKGAGRASYKVKMAYISARRLVRRFAIDLGLHKPYNW